MGAVYQMVKTVPYGRATSYGAIARAIGYPNMSRMVGRVLGGCSEVGVPAYRIVNSQGIGNVLSKVPECPRYNGL